MGFTASSRLTPRTAGVVCSIEEIGQMTGVTRRSAHERWARGRCLRARMPFRPGLRSVVLAVALVLASAPFLLAASPAAADPSGPVVIDTHTSVHPPEIYSMTSSGSGTLYGSDRKGDGHIYFRPAPLASGTVDTDLGTDISLYGNHSIVGNKIAIPVENATRDRVTSVKWCTAGSCTTMASILMAATENYLANTGTGVLIYATDGTRQLRIKLYAGGSPQVVGTVPFMPQSANFDAAADATGAVIGVDGQTMYVNFTATPHVTPLTSGGQPLWENSVALSPGFLARHFFNGSTSVISRISRTALSSTPVTFTAASDAIYDLHITNTGTAWTAPDPSGTDDLVFTRTAGGSSNARYVRPLTNRALSVYENTSDFLIADRAAPTPGFYRLAPGATGGTFVGVLGSKYARTSGLAVSLNRVLYSNNSTADDPVFLRDVSALPALGGETTVSAASANDGYTKDLSGPFVAFARPNATTPTRTDIVYGRPGTALSTYTLPVGAEAWGIQVSGHRALIMGNSNRLVDLVSGSVSSVASDVYARLWGDFLVTLGINTALFQRRNLVTGAVATIRAADPACGTNCVDDDSMDFAFWGNQVAYRFQGPGEVLRSGVWTATSATTGTTTALPSPAANTIRMKMSDGLLYTDEYPDVVKLYDLRTGTNALVDSSAFNDSVDGYRVGFQAFTDGRGRVADVRRYLPAYALSPPRLLSASVAGGFAADSAGTGRWRSRFFASRDVSWRLQIHSGGAAGPVVRSFSDTSVFGEMTPAGGWDGLDGFGTPVPQGTYTWTVTGADGTQPLTMSDGTTTKTGTVYVSRTAPAAPAVTAPARSTDTSATTSFGISWSAASAPAGSRYTIKTSTNGGAFTTLLSNTSARSTTVSASVGQTRRFQVTVTDPGGRTSAAGTATTVVPYDSASGTVSGSWSTVSSSTRYLSSVRSSGSAGATISFTAAGTAISVIGDVGPTNGQFQVSYDGGAYSAAIDTVATTGAVRKVLASKTFTGAAASHTVKVRVVGTSGRPAVSVDAFGYTR